MMQGSEGPYIQYEQLVSRNPHHTHRWSHRDETGNDLSSFDEELTVASRSGISLKSIFRVVGTMANITGQTTSKMLLSKKVRTSPSIVNSLPSIVGEISG
jgi:hypothetical protein